MTETTSQIREKTPALKPLLAQNNLSGLSVCSLKLIKQNIGRFLARAQIRQLTKSIDMKTKLDNAVN